MVLGTWPASAYPPAPHHTLFGMIRNQWGDPIWAENPIVILQTSNAAALKAAIVPSTEPGVNYRLSVPMDAGVTPELYIPTALRRGQPFQLKVQVGNVTYLPIEMALGSATLGQSAESTRLDLTLGEDTDHDGLPDEWERAIIAALGGTLASITADGDADGDGVSNLNEYLSGTYAFDPNDGFRLSVVQVDAGNTTLEFLAIRGRTYSLQGSSDLQQWSPVNFRVVTGQTVGALQGNFVSPDVRILRVEVPFQIGTEAHRYFKAVVQ